MAGVAVSFGAWGGPCGHAPCQKKFALSTLYPLPENQQRGIIGRAIYSKKTARMWEKTLPSRLRLGLSAHVVQTGNQHLLKALEAGLGATQVIFSRICNTFRVAAKHTAARNASK
jgi:hypothetical protein